MTSESSSMVKRRGAGQRHPPGHRYTAWEWISGYLMWLVVLPFYLGLWAFARVFKRVPNWLLKRLQAEHYGYTSNHNYDVRIPADHSVPPYMLRWWRIRKNAFFNVYYHIVRRSDDDRALHDHPWWNFSIVLVGSYFEHCINEGGVHTKIKYGPGAVRFRPRGTFAHRLELERFDEEAMIGMRGTEKPVHTIFITGPTLRRWGFHHPDRWVDAYDWDQFCDERGIGGIRMEGYAEQQVKGPR
jgi:hypothetical protein